MTTYVHNSYTLHEYLPLIVYLETTPPSETADGETSRKARSAHRTQTCFGFEMDMSFARNSAKYLPSKHAPWVLIIVIVLAGTGFIWRDRYSDRVLAHIDWQRPVYLVVQSVYDTNPNGFVRRYRAFGYIPGRPEVRSVPVYRDLLPALRPGVAIELFDTGEDEADPFVTKAFRRSAEPRWVIGPFSFTWTLIVGILFYVVAGLLAYDRSFRARPARAIPNPTFWLGVAPQYEAMVQRLTVMAARQPRLYRLKIVLLTALGYAFPLAVMILLVASIVLIVWLLGHGNSIPVVLLVPFLFLAWAIAKGLMVLDARAPGLKITRGEAPALFALLDRIRKATGAPRIHRVQLTLDNNASMLRRNRFRVPFWPERILSIGLPLLILADETDLAAVLAHECAHSMEADGNTSYRIRRRLSAIYANIGIGSGLTLFGFKHFFNWFVPYFNAYSFVLARQTEYAADRLSAEAVSAVALSNVLTRLKLDDIWLETTFWPAFWREADQRDRPSQNAFAEMRKHAEARSSSAPYRNGLMRLARERTGLADTHPSLSDRLAALGAALRLPDPVAVAALGLLGGATDTALAWADQRWKADNLSPWMERFEQAQELRKERAPLEEELAAAPLKSEQAIRLALLRERFADARGAKALLEDLGRSESPNPWALLHLGRILLDEDGDAGVACLERAMATDAALILPAVDALSSYFESRGECERLDPYRAQAEARARFEQAVRAERSSVGPKTTFLPHGLDAERLRTVTDQLTQRSDIRRVWVVRKQLEHSPETPLLVLLVEARKRFSRQSWLLHRILAGEIAMPYQTLFVGLGLQRSVRGRIVAVAESLIWDRSRSSVFSGPSPAGATAPG